MRPIIFLIVFVSAINAFAAQPVKTQSSVKIDTKKIDQLVNDYYLSKKQKNSSLSFLSLTNGQRCGPNRTDCLDAACSHLPPYLCDDQSEIDRVLTACRGVEGDCIQASCSHMPAYMCDDMSEIETVAQSCRSVFDSRCIDTVCSHMPAYMCDDMSEISRVGAACRGRVDSGCIDSVCKRLASYQCDDMSELEAIAKRCGGN